jgi:PBSX family phage portal protein
MSEMRDEESRPPLPRARATWVSPPSEDDESPAELLYHLPDEVTRAEKKITRLYRRATELRARLATMGTALPFEVSAELSSIEAQIQSELRKPTAQLDEFAWMIRLGVVLAPYVDPKRCIQMVEGSDALSTCIAAMSTNVGGHGFELVPALSSTQLHALSDEARREMDLEKVRLENFFHYSSPNRSFAALREVTTKDKETCGFAGWELIEREVPDERGNTVAGLEHMPAWSLRLTPLSDFVEAEVWRLSENGRWEKIVQPRRFRLVVQIIEGQYRYFKQFGDPRVIHRFTGATAKGEAEAAQWKEGGVAAGSCLFFSIYHPLTPYGAPRWLGAASSALGRRLAQQVNLAYWDSKAIPPMAVLVSGGGLTEESMQALTERFRNLKGVQHFHDILVIETLPAQTNELDPGGKTNVRVELKPLTEAIQKEGIFREYQEDAREDVRTVFRLPAIVTGLSRDYNFACYSGDTETLTESGWKKHGEIATDEKIAAFDPQTRRIEFVRPVAKHVYDYDGEMVWFRSRSVDCLVTPNHRMLARKAGDDAFSVHRADGLPWARLELPAAGTWETTDREPEWFVLPKSVACRIERGHRHDECGRVRFDDWLEFLGYMISEGGIINSDCEAADYYSYIVQKKPAAAAKMQVCFDRLGWRYSKTDGAGVTRWLWSNRCLREWLMSHQFGRYSDERRIPEEYLHLSTRQLRILLDALMLGDGHRDIRPGRTAGTYYTSSFRLAGQVQQILLQLGHRALVRPGEARFGQGPMFRVICCERRTSRLDAARGQIRRVPYKGEVYCYSVPSHGFFVTRRNGTPAFQGNTADASMRVAEQQVFQPERNQEDFVINHLLLPVLGARYWRFRTKPAHTSDEQAATALISTMSSAGALTPNEIRTVGAPLLGAELPQINEPWAAQPFPLTLAQSSAAAGGLAGGPWTAPAPQTPADAAIAAAKKLLLSPLDVSVGGADDAHVEAAEAAVQGPRPAPKEVTSADPAPVTAPRARDDGRARTGPRVWRMQLPASALEGAQVVNGIIRLNEEVQAEIARRWEALRSGG